VAAARRPVALLDRDGAWPAPGGRADWSAGPAARRVTARDGLIRVEARLLGQFELLIKDQPVQHWRGNRGRMLLAFLLLHRARPLTRDELGGAFWPDAAPDVVRNRVHVAIHGLRKDLRAVCEHPIVVHGRRASRFIPGSISGSTPRHSTKRWAPRAGNSPVTRGAS
jgi:hypothetical protein